jgi:hypothetical protein
MEWSEPMLNRLNWALIAGVAASFLHFAPAALRAEQDPQREQGVAQEKDAPSQPALAPSDSVTIPDGTPLSLEFVAKLSSATAKLGDKVELRALELKIGDLTVVPDGTLLSGTVVRVRPARRMLRRGQLVVAVEQLNFPGGEFATLRSSKSATGKPASTVARPESGDFSWKKFAVLAPFDPVTASVLLVLAPFAKGDEAVYRAGSSAEVYMNGPVSVTRSALLKPQAHENATRPQELFSGAMP